MTWESFLRKTADEFGLSPEQTEVFLMRFSEDNKQKSDGDIQKLFETHHQLEPAAYRKRKTALYNKLKLSRQNPNGCKEMIDAGSHKAKHLFKWLEARYAEEALELKNSGNSLQTNEVNHLEERFNNAVAQLGSDDTFVLLSSIDALEQIAKDAEERYYWRVMEKLTLYVRVRSPWNKEKAAQAEQEISPLPTDIQAVMTVIARRKHSYGHPLEIHCLNLREVDLRGLELPPGAKLSGVDFSRSNLSKVDFREADLQKAYLSATILERAFLVKAKLYKADLELSNLKNAFLTNAELQEARLTNANLQNAFLKETCLKNAFLTNANLQEAFLLKANLREAILLRANLREAILWEANLYRTDMREAVLQGASFGCMGFHEAVGLTWKQLGEATLYDRESLPDYLLTQQPQAEATQTATQTTASAQFEGETQVPPPAETQLAPPESSGEL